MLGLFANIAMAGSCRIRGAIAHVPCASVDAVLPDQSDLSFCTYCPPFGPVRRTRTYNISRFSQHQRPPGSIIWKTHVMNQRVIGVAGNLEQETTDNEERN